MKNANAKRSRRGRRCNESAFPVEPHAQSITALAVEAMRRGLAGDPAPRREEAIPHEGRVLRCGDPDENPLDAEYVGDDVPGGSAPTPDQSGVDEIGRLYGLQEEDSGALRTSSEVLDRRDRHRPELVAPRERNDQR